MSAETIRDHFVKFLGVDVGVSFIDADRPSQVILYRPGQAFRSDLSDRLMRRLKRRTRSIASDIERVVVSFETS